MHFNLVNTGNQPLATLYLARGSRTSPQIFFTLATLLTIVTGVNSTHDSRLCLNHSAFPIL